MQRSLRSIALSIAILSALTVAAPLARAQAVAQFDLPAQPLADSLRAVAKQTNSNVLFDRKLVRGRTAPALKAQGTLDAALIQLLEGSGLKHQFVDEKTVTVVDPTKPAASRRSEAEAGVDSKPTASNLASPAGSERYTRLAQAEPTPAAVPAVRAGTADSSRQERIELEEIVVTGSHIHRDTIDGPSPVIVYDRQQLERSGASNLSDFIARLPQSVSSPVTDTAAATRDGSRAVNLRGLGPGATLVLVNGRRQLTGAASQDENLGDSSVNLNVIPFGAIDRVEVLTDGASAIYGSDAVGGIVNVILRKDFTGFESRSRYANTTRQDLRELSQTFVGGLSKDQLSVLFSADYFEREGLLVADRDSALASLRAAASPTVTAAMPSQPANIFATSGNLPGLDSNSAAVPRGQDGTNLAPASFSTTLNPLLPPTALSTLYTPQERKSGHMGLRYSATDDLELFLDGSATHLKNHYSNPQTFNRLRVPATNAFNPFGVDVLASFSFPGSDTYDTVTDDYGVTTGFDLRFSDRLRLDAHVSWGESRAESERRRFAADAIAAALARTDRNTALNVFGDGLVNRPSVIAEITRTSSQRGETSTRAAAAKLEASLLRLPAGDLKAVIGGERREDDLQYISINGLTTPFSVAAQYAPTRDVNSAFAELAIPLLRDRLGLRAVDFSVAGRYDDYSDFGDTSNPQLGLTVRPLRSLLIRANYGTSFLAPSFSQMFVPERALTNPPAIFDPVLNETYNFQTLIHGGNADLIPQSADTLSAGLVLEPPALDRFRLMLNWFRINYDDKIVFQSFRDIVLLESLFPENIVRDPANGNRIVSVRQGPVNVSRVETSGIDASVSYRFGTAVGEFDANLAATHVFHYRSQTTPMSPVVDLVGTVQNPKSWEGSGSLFFTRGGFAVGSTVRYVDAYTRIAGAATFRVSPSVIVSAQSSYEYVPRAGSGWPKSLQFAVGLENAFDEQPSSDGSSWGFDTTEGDLRGRQYYLTLRARF